MLNPGDWQALGLSLRLALFSALLLVPICLPLAFWLARSRSAWRLPVQALAAIPLILPSTVLGYYLVVAFSPQTAVGQGWQALFDVQFAFSFPGLLLGSMAYSLPFALQPLTAGFHHLQRGWSEVAATLGLSPLQRFHRVLIPQMRTPVLDALALVFAHSMGEFGIVLMIGGAIPSTRTASIAMYEHFESLDFASADRLALGLVAISLVLLVPLYAVRRARGATGPNRMP